MYEVSIFILLYIIGLYGSIAFIGVIQLFLATRYCIEGGSEYSIDDIVFVLFPFFFFVENLINDKNNYLS